MVIIFCSAFKQLLLTIWRRVKRSRRYLTNSKFGSVRIKPWVLISSKSLLSKVDEEQGVRISDPVYKARKYCSGIGITWVPAGLSMALNFSKATLRSSFHLIKVFMSLH